MGETVRHGAPKEKLGAQAVPKAIAKLAEKAGPSSESEKKIPRHGDPWLLDLGAQCYWRNE